jgi:hypothetical protein
VRGHPKIPPHPRRSHRDRHALVTDRYPTPHTRTLSTPGECLRLGPLLDYDAGKDAQLVDTLSCYLECGGNYDLTAKTLSLHRSTLRYRLQRIRDISGHDLNNPDTRFNLQLATRAWTTVHAMCQ